MTSDEMMGLIRRNLRLDTADHDLKIQDVIRDVCDYCNLSPDCLPGGLEPLVRGKVQGMMAYEAEKGNGYQAEVASISEGDISVSFAQSGQNAKEYVYGLNVSDISQLNRYRKLVW